ncbi:MAG TPA: glycosyltransferase, partial [Bacteroidetes bacterium]|nr:glycosyltransferase [Bacteroidota bacterium]
VGDGALRGELEREASTLGITDNVIFTGARNDIEEILRISNVCVLSSRREGFPMVLLEAMSTGIPCISTNVGCVNELITHEVGAIVPIEDSAALADAIATLYGKIDDLKRMGEKARKIIVEKYDINDVLTHYLNVLVDGNQSGLYK